ncbi:TPA: hypothetical protein DCZ36_04010 [Candidatus Gracilibacteria bacterium]|nr:hypothetical protein [Candidatus Gracilibacteria bacterium]
MKIFSSFLNCSLIVFLFSSFLITSAYAGENDCVIKNGMSEELAAYIKTTDSLLAGIGEEATKKQCNANANGENSASASVNKTKSAVVGSMNESIGFSNFATSGRFYIGIALKTEIPAGITRDHERLGKEIERINGMIEMVHGRCAEDTVSTSNLSEDPVYNTSGKTLGTILTEVLKNQVNMMNFYRETVLGDRTDDSYAFILVGDSKVFKSKLQKSYGPDAFEKCNKESDFFKDIKDAFGRITSLGGGIGKGMKEWENAMNLFHSTSSNPEYAETERNVLRNELSNQGMSTKSSQVIMNNLAKYNSQHASEGLSGFVTSIGERVYASIAEFGKAYDGIRDMLTKPQTTDKYMETTQILATLKTDINDDIITDYINAKDLIGPENQSVDETVAKLIDTHVLLESTNSHARSYIKIAEQTCEGQSMGEGNCRYR